MRLIRLPSEALWQVIRQLSVGEMRKVQQRLQGKRLRWLLQTLHRMDVYAESRLLRAYKRTFPKADAALLSSYEYQLWAVLLEVLPSTASEVQQEVEVWRLLWVSSVLWQRGLTEPARILWHKGIQLAVECGWYEVALWGVSLLEIYMRDPHLVAPGEQIAAWSEKLLNLVHARYQGIAEKLSALEGYVQSRIQNGWQFPTLPSRDGWALYMKEYSEFFAAARQSDFITALDHAEKMLRILTTEVVFPPSYRHMHLLRTMLNLAIHLLNLHHFDLYAHWDAAWRHIWTAGIPRTGRYAELYRIGVALRLIFFMHTCQWRSARALYDEDKETFYELVFLSAESVRFRVQIGAHVVLTLLLTQAKSETLSRWQNWLDDLIHRENFRDYPYVWWVFLQWYAAYRSGKAQRLYYRYLKVRQAWSRYTSHWQAWIPFLDVLRSVSLGILTSQRRKARLLLHRIQIHPEERLFWQEESNLFQVELFLRSLLRACQIEDLPPQVPDPVPIPNELHQRVSDTLHKICNHNPLS